MVVLASIQPGQVDLVAMILQSRSLNARLTKDQVEAYIEKVKKLPHDQQVTVYNILLDEQQKFADISDNMKKSAKEYEQRLEQEKVKILHKVYVEAEKEEKEVSDEEMSTLLHQLDKQ